MKLVAQAKALAVATKAAAGAIDDKTAKRRPILGALLIGADNHNLRFVGTDLDLAIAARCNGAIEEPGRCAAAGEALSKLLAGVASDSEVVIETVNTGLQIRAGRARYKLPALPAANFPVSPATSSTTEIVLSRDEVRHLFGAVAFAANTEDARFYLKGIYLHLDSGGYLCGVATDGHRLALATSTIMPAPGALPANGDGIGVIVPLKTVNLINGLRATEIELRVDGSVLEIRADDLLISSKLVAGTFPPYPRIIPAKSDNVAELERASLLAALWRLRAVRDVTEQMINMTLSWQDGDDAVRLALADGEIGEDIIAATTTGAGSITLSTAQMLVMAEEIEAEQLQLSVSGKTDPLRIAAGEQFLAVLAPCTK